MDFIYAFLVGIYLFNWATIVRFRKVNTSSFNGNFCSHRSNFRWIWIVRLIKFAGAGATVPITSFGHSLLHGAMHAENMDI